MPRGSFEQYFIYSFSKISNIVISNGTEEISYQIKGVNSKCQGGLVYRTLLYTSFAYNFTELYNYVQCFYHLLGHVFLPLRCIFVGNLLNQIVSHIFYHIIIPYCIDTEYLRTFQKKIENSIYRAKPSIINQIVEKQTLKLRSKIL